MGNREQYAVDLSSTESPGTSLDSVLLRLATDFLDLPTDEIGSGIERILSVIGDYSGADCSGVSELDHRNGQMRELHTWTRPGCDQRSGAGSAIDVNGLAELFGDYREPTLVCDAVTDARLPDGLGDAFAAFGMRSLAWVPVSSDERRVVAVGFTSAQPIEWSDEHVALLRAAGKMIFNLLARSETVASLDRTTLMLEELTQSLEHHFFLWAIDPPRVLYSNGQIEKLNGLPIAEFNAAPVRFLEVILPEYRRSFSALFEKAMSRPAELEYRVRCADGSIRWLRTRVFPGTNDNRLEAHIAGLTEDVTERVAIAEKGARLKEFEAILNRISGRFVQTALGDMDGALSRALAEICEFAGVERGHVYLFDRNRETMREISRWQSSESAPHEDELRMIPSLDIPYFKEAVTSGSVACLDEAGDLPESAVADRAFLRRHGIQSCLVIPLMSATESIGAFVLSTLSRRRSWSADDVTVSTLAANTFAAAVARRTAESEQQQGIRFERLVTSLVSEFMNLPVDQLDQGIESAIATIARFVGCDRAAIFLVQKGRDYADVYRGWLAPGTHRIAERDIRVDIGPGSTYGEWIRSGQRYLLLDPAAIGAIGTGATEAVERSRIGTVVNVPIVVDGRRIGWFLVGAGLPRVNWAEAELRSLSVGADALANMYSRRLTEVERQRHKKFEELLSKLAADFIKRPISEVRTGIEEIVDRFGRFSRCDRAAVLLIDQERRTASTYYERVHRGVPAPVRDFPVGAAPRFYEQIMTSPGPCLINVEEFPDSDRLAVDALEAIGIRTLLNCPITDGDQVFGYASIGYPDARHRPVSGTEELLGIAAGIIANAFSRQRLEQQTLVQHDALARALRIGSLNQLATGIAHELNQPLTAIANYSRACVRRLEGPDSDWEGLAEILGRVSDQAIRAGDIVHNLRTHVRAGPGKRTSASVRTIVDHALTLLAGTGNDHGVKLTVEYAADLPNVQVEPTEIEQVVINIVQNAIDSIVAADSDRCEVGITVVRDRAFVEVEIADTGPGFRDEDATKLFDQFHTTKPGALGLGLSISRELMEYNGGTIEAENSPDGAIFRIALPVAPVPRSGPAGTTAK